MPTLPPNPNIDRDITGTSPLRSALPKVDQPSVYVVYLLQWTNPLCMWCRHNSGPTHYVCGVPTTVD